MKQTLSMAWYVNATRRPALMKRFSLLVLHSCTKLPLWKGPSTLMTDTGAKIVFMIPELGKMEIDDFKDVEDAHITPEHKQAIISGYYVTIIKDQYFALDVVNGKLRFICLTNNTQQAPFKNTSYLVVYPGDIENNPGNKFVTSYGRYLVNYYLIARPFITNGVILPGMEFINATWNTGKLEAVIARYLTEKKLDVSQANRYIDNAYFLSSIGEIAGATLSRKAITPNEAIIKRRDELYKQYEGQLSDPRISTIIENELIAMDKDYLKGDPSMAFFGDTAKKFNIHRKRQYLALGMLEEFSKTKGKYTFVKESLVEGFSKESFSDICNEIRRGSFDRGVETQVAGLDTKWMVAVFQNCRIVGDDCGTKDTLTVTPSTYTIGSYIGAYVKTGERTLVKMMNFPVEEHARLSEQDVLYTTRISKDRINFALDDIVSTPWEKTYKIIQAQEFTNVEDHPFIGELTAEQKRQLAGQPFTLFKLARTRVVQGYTPITYDNQKQFVDKTIQIRSMQYCKQPEGFCPVCSYKSFEDLGFKNSGTQPIDIGAVFLALSMSSMHGTKVDSFRLETLDDLGKYFL